MENLNKKFAQLVINHGLKYLQDKPELLENEDELHNELFNTDYFVIGYFEANQILKESNYNAFDVISDLIEFEENMLGESSLKTEDINPEKVVNLLAYFYGQELLEEIIETYNEQK